MIPLRIDETNHRLFLPVKVTPNSSRNEILPWQPADPHVRLKVTAAPEDGKANKAVMVHLSKALGLPKTAITLAQGTTARQKVFQIQCPNAEALNTCLQQLAHELQSDPNTCFRPRSV